MACALRTRASSRSGSSSRTSRRVDMCPSTAAGECEVLASKRRRSVIGGDVSVLARRTRYRHRRGRVPRGDRALPERRHGLRGCDQSTISCATPRARYRVHDDAHTATHAHVRARGAVGDDNHGRRRAVQARSCAAGRRTGTPPMSSSHRERPRTRSGSARQARRHTSGNCGRRFAPRSRSRFATDLAAFGAASKRSRARPT